MKYFKWFVIFIMFIGGLVSTIFALFLLTSGIKMIYSELLSINETLTTGILLIIIGGSVLMFYYQLIKNITFKND